MRLACSNSLLVRVRAGGAGRPGGVSPIVSKAPSVHPPAAAAPPAAGGRAREGSILGYAFSTRDVAGSVGYSGRPLDIVAAVTPDGIIAGARIVAHEAPILVAASP